LIGWAEAMAGTAAAARAVTAVIDRMIFFIGSVPSLRRLVDDVGDRKTLSA
jgi:hypothetical protein